MAEGRITAWVKWKTQGIRMLHRPGGAGLLHSMTGIFDRVLGDASTAAREGMLLECSDAALDFHARNAHDRRVTIETDAALRAYLKTRWDRKKEAGTEDGLRYQCARLGYPNVEFWSWQRLKLAGVPGATAFGGRVGFWFLVIRHPHPFSLANAPVWDDGGDWNQDGRHWGGAASSDLDQLLNELEFTVHKWRPSGRSPRFVVVDLDGTLQVLTTAPYDFAGNYQIFPFFEDIERFGGPPSPFYSSSFVTP